jgi:hypothetical protein
VRDRHAERDQCGIRCRCICTASDTLRDADLRRIERGSGDPQGFANGDAVRRSGRVTSGVLELVRHRGGVSEQADRWTKATVYPDMWVNPDEDPRNGEGVTRTASWRHRRTTYTTTGSRFG